MTYRITLRQHDILVYLEAHPGATTSEITSALQYSLSAVAGCLMTLYKNRLVSRTARLGEGHLDDWRQVNSMNPWRWYSARTVATTAPTVACTDADGVTATTKGGRVGEAE